MLADYGAETQLVFLPISFHIIRRKTVGFVNCLSLSRMKVSNGSPPYSENIFRMSSRK